MFEKFLKKSGWTDIIISTVFILFGAMMIARPDSIVTFIAIFLGLIFVLLGVMKLYRYYSNGQADSYILAISIVSIIIGIIIMFCGHIILSFFSILIAVWIIYSGIMNLQTAIIWKDYKSRLWITSLVLSLLIIVAGIYLLVNRAAIIQTIGIVIVGYGIIDILENIIFINKNK